MEANSDRLVQERRMREAREQEEMEIQRKAALYNNADPDPDMWRKTKVDDFVIFNLWYKNLFFNNNGYINFNSFFSKDE